MYALAMIIDYYYWKHDHKCHHIRQVEKEAFESHFWKQEKAFTSGPTMASQNKANLSLVVSSTKIFSSKPSLFFAPKKQSYSLQMDLSSKLASNNKLTSDKYKKYLKNSLCLYCGTRDHKLNSCSKNQTTVTPKGYSTLVATSKKLLEK